MRGHELGQSRGAVGGQRVTGHPAIEAGRGGAVSQSGITPGVGYLEMWGW